MSNIFERLTRRRDPIPTAEEIVRKAAEQLSKPEHAPVRRSKTRRERAARQAMRDRTTAAQNRLDDEIALEKRQTGFQLKNEGAKNRYVEAVVKDLKVKDRLGAEFLARLEMTDGINPKMLAQIQTIKRTRIKVMGPVDIVEEVWKYAGALGLKPDTVVDIVQQVPGLAKKVMGDRKRGGRVRRKLLERQGKVDLEKAARAQGQGLQAALKLLEGDRDSQVGRGSDESVVEERGKKKGFWRRGR
ncbi:MAG: hypothetical protein UX91_C0003G0042 [Candidatus Amesbacteria bacterium GW2011_GWB1_47_19]|nr:MAG: hypothetical protein UW51_C0003G0048 [Candidatus Amesbacteria bacterium GW2011_GWA1_44_24]KKU31473.1 MAG: hypothetical protein UX46_C0005G0042 [Candidatus Amesbacteria bacterium GW2011_GWC1_46_24]KKU67481.1 MAG: hypothetical protein UX91_C0003G0042 [Candidatus Amesbacteria bacterium GW2011_GWB1_47_19]OGD05130.1 MAG: hypothetical protein A2379_05120 [Candidatus Amesbacteria bacterium RIFOXYB1_FULL_47_13]HBC72490.1 hypothetical protein [Candidatus Amesbacteria bacterium]